MRKSTTSGRYADAPFLKNSLWVTNLCGGQNKTAVHTPSNRDVPGGIKALETAGL